MVESHLSSTVVVVVVVVVAGGGGGVSVKKRFLVRGFLAPLVCWVLTERINIHSSSPTQPPFSFRLLYISRLLLNISFERRRWIAML